MIFIIICFRFFFISPRDQIAMDLFKKQKSIYHKKTKKVKKLDLAVTNNIVSSLLIKRFKFNKMNMY